MVFKILFKAKAKAVKATTMESVHNRTSIKNHCSHETCCRNNTSLNKRTKWSFVLKRLLPLEDLMFIKKQLGQIQKLMAR